MLLESISHVNERKEQKSERFEEKKRMKGKTERKRIFQPISINMRKCKIMKWLRYLMVHTAIVRSFIMHIQLYIYDDMSRGLLAILYSLDRLIKVYSLWMCVYVFLLYVRLKIDINNSEERQRQWHCRQSKQIKWIMREYKYGECTYTIRKIVENTKYVHTFYPFYIFFRVCFCSMQMCPSFCKRTSYWTMVTHNSQIFSKYLCLALFSGSPTFSPSNCDAFAYAYARNEYFWKAELTAIVLR